ncbi:MAG: hypothetical protein U1E48_13335 [Paracoccaceae bacterium]
MCEGALPKSKARRKRLDCSGNDRLSRKLRRLAHAEGAYGKLVGVIQYLELLNAQNIDQRVFLRPVMDYSLTAYASIFNSGNLANDGIGVYSAVEMFEDGPHRDFHKIVMSYRDKEVAHLTSFSQKTNFIVTEGRWEIAINGHLERDLFCNIVQPDQPSWDIFLHHLTATRDWFKIEKEKLTKDITRIMKKLPKKFFEDLLDAPKPPPLIEVIIDAIEERPDHFSPDYLQTPDGWAELEDIFRQNGFFDYRGS